MWQEYLARAHLYKKLADYYRYRNTRRYLDYERIYYEYLKRFAEVYVQETGLDPQPYLNLASHSAASKAESRLTAIRLLHASPSLGKIPLDIYVNGRLLIRMLPYGVTSKYFLLPGGEYRFDVFPTGRKRFKPLSSQSLNLEAGTHSLIGMVDGGLMTYRQEPNPVKDRVRIRFIHLAAGVSELSIALSDGTVLTRRIGLTEATEYFTLSPVKNRFVFKQVNTEEPIFATSEIHLREEKVYTLIILYAHQRIYPLILRDLGRFSHS
ncbi:DUF4397 domain-containing protein [Lihuaxuella thermophila]|uniref:DUF4397 domain-containing protein n=1 Tax=Lihuaxuella thermophila TaxID=1173111 RepID=A0A1H8CE54_9BACL|nr:DUF4397 domain-containing protein [Lihuaxuella thermophila]SEM93315.1 protein of unknown function [Lihuaxuella thermophila]